MTLEEFSAGEQKTERETPTRVGPADVKSEPLPQPGRAPPGASAKGRSHCPCPMDKVGDALEEVLSKALSQRTITVGVYEAAKLLNVDPDNVVLCLLAADEDDDRDVALQIHFTLIQAFCCENDINILRVSNPGRLAELLLLETGTGPAASEGAEQPPDLHCVLVTNPHSSQWKDPALSQLICFCRESRYMDQWVPVINLPER
ncbi:growth arrest and DNA damage-inducible protein GADD45 alpha isoform X1 [Dasypus novemcinctus]|uniref:growth arrest and DNA damage-inducible protein GADD45 alpha isoform X1 n=1 Tax=Dasypus novemcinctus TaxID=9361 RepID=UPI00265F7D0A|nr:growth arrest and DNA damage-inducible protein GADD45 alpha isoform X1 [Dasypus novemcinctus]